jgi:hypothetical protein
MQSYAKVTHVAHNVAVDIVEMAECGARDSKAAMATSAVSAAQDARKCLERGDDLHAFLRARNSLQYAGTVYTADAIIHEYIRGMIVIACAS